MSAVVVDILLGLCAHQTSVQMQFPCSLCSWHIVCAWPIFRRIMWTVPETKLNNPIRRFQLKETRELKSCGQFSHQCLRQLPDLKKTRSSNLCSVVSKTPIELRETPWAEPTTSAARLMAHSRTTRFARTRVPSSTVTSTSLPFFLPPRCRRN